MDDEEGVRKLLAAVLTANGYDVLEAGNGPAALAAYEKNSHKIDLVVTDVVMPQTSGFELGSELAGRGAGPEDSLHVGLPRQLPRNRGPTATRVPAKAVHPGYAADQGPRGAGREGAGVTRVAVSTPPFGRSDRLPRMGTLGTEAIDDSKRLSEQIGEIQTSLKRWKYATAALALILAAVFLAVTFVGVWLDREFFGDEKFRRWLVVSLGSPASWGR